MAASPTYLAVGDTVTGQIASGTDIHVAGQFTGNINASRLSIAPGGSVKGDVTV